ncbi:periplasmic peptidase, S41 family, PDZ/DHR/GLGF domain-containing [Syntrophotalea carbinolica DSM 2380]|uniref:Periplasmic peptidase, S41 family, PDZ/DHR/GLGF domain-containing n=1 Tax=Syntrophotalea carbinolica (strain DSM 2380 / NBRC 103641 / GraBd1) TaxID=338963 RepID=Q3A405_SYNC1|nr:carboxy terminal-processing peptidase [Syntrophotalea carbinolica]ABA88902.1 periplasmic peptidase, S41 family, PDZ/DHR/GLGF domain-containing [Syntrophotalea carbinolica DSM 2380]
MKFKKIRFYLLAVILLIAVSGSWVGLASQQPPEDLEHLRIRLLTHLISQQMSTNHFSHKALDDTLSAAAFDLYAQQLDYQKRFLIREDIDRLGAERHNIDDQIVRGELSLPKTGARLLRLRVETVSGMIPEILDHGFDFTVNEVFETDPEKIDYAEDMAGLKNRWQQILKYQVLMRYVQLYEEQNKAAASSEHKALPVKAVIDAALLEQAVQKVRRSTEHLLDRLLEQTEKDHFERFLNAFVRAYDPHSAYLAPDALEDFEIYMKGSLEGIGATLREDDGFIRVVEIIPGSPAAKQGQLAAEDIILKVGEGNQEPIDVTETRLRDAVRLIRGKKGTEVHLTIRKPTGAERVIAITRDVVEIEEGFAKSTTVPVSGHKGQCYGYLRIPSFYRDFQGSREGRQARNVTDDVRRELEQLKKQGITGLVLDLRNNGGGSLSDAISVAGLFIASGPVVQVKSSDGDIRVFEDEDPGIVYGGPLVVMVNRFSASASEILAGAIQDYGRGVVVGGDGTHGKGTVQAIFDMDQPLTYSPLAKLKPLGALKVTVQKFYRINGGSTQVKGVEPDIHLPDRLAFLESGEKYIEYALPWDTITNVPFKRWSRLPNVAELRRLSEQRVTNGHRFDAIVAETRRNRQRSRDTLRSVRLTDILEERSALRAAGAEDFVEDLASKRLSPDKDFENLADEISGDLYVGEAMAVLTDMKQLTANSDSRIAGQLSAVH